MITKKVEIIKVKLLNAGYLDNEYLEKYLNLIEANLTTKRVWGKTQSHHAIPASIYRDYEGAYNRLVSKKLADTDNDNIIVNLLYCDHLIAHAYLTLCSDLTKIQQAYEEQADLRKVNSQIGVNAYNKKYKNKIEQKKQKSTEQKIDQRDQRKNQKQQKQKLVYSNLCKFYSAEEADEIYNL